MHTTPPPGTGQNGAAPAEPRRPAGSPGDPAAGGPLLHELVAATAARTPDATAVVDDHRELGYAELNRRANRLAHHLRALGARPDDLVGVCLHRGVDLAVALLAVWKAGAAYVPFDPNHPKDRVDWVLRDTGARIVLTERALADLVRADGVHAVVLDSADCGRDLAARPDTDPGPGATADHLAYVIHTSGSTGRPKGVAVSHGGIRNRVAWTVRTHGLGPGDRVLQKTSLSFDAAGWEFFGPLSSGGTVVMAPPGVERDPAEMVRTVARQRISVLQVVPSVLRLLVEESGWADCTAMRLVFSAGEPLHAELCQRLLARVDVQIWNTYGPTECSIDVTARRFDPQQRTGPVLIGRPISGIRLLVLDADGELAPIGLPGELHVGGAGVARGYVNRPDLTAERFVPDPYGPAGERLYRTGDQVRWLADGSLEYLGRLDGQVKVNGVRIEPGEIEAVLAGHPQVRAAAVAAVRNAAGIGRIVAYLTVRDDPGHEELRAWCRERLPEYLVPAVFTVLAEFPLTTSGKLDRKALPAPGPQAPASTGRTAPATATERIVAAIWAELLDTPDIAAEDDFFRLGGYSLLLGRLAQRLRAATGREIALADLFTASTVRDQARLLDLAGADRTAVTRTDRSAPLPLSAGQQRMWFLDQLTPGSAEYVVPVFLRLPADTDPAVLGRALDALAARHEALRTRYPLTAGRPVQQVEAPGRVELAVTDAAGPDLPALFGAEIARSFDLARGPVWRALLARRPDHAHLLLTVHHIACDGWSTVLIKRELRALYTALADGAEPALDPLPIGYPDFAAWQREHHLTPDLLERQLAHWRGVLAGLPTLRTPTDRPRPAHREAHGAVHAFSIPAPTAEALFEIGRGRGATPFMTLLALWQILLGQHGGQHDLAIGTPVAGRIRPETHGLVGFFLNSLVLRTELGTDLSFEQAVDRVRDTCRAAFAHQDLPFEQLVEALQPTRDPSRTPLYQALFDLQDDGLTGLAEDTADLAEFGAAWRTTPTDLALIMRRQENGDLGGLLEYASALFDPRTAESLAEGLATLAGKLAADPGAALSAVDVRTGRDRERAALPWNVRHPAVPGTAGTAGTPGTPDADPPPARAEHLAPRNPFEQRLAEIWAEALETPVGVRDDFFALGGNSLLAATVTAAARAELDLDIPVRALFDGPTVEQWALALEDLIRAEIAQLSDEDVVADTTRTKGQPA
ncbi:amino acid adenylation domain-containing protein [Kitasatospora sp. NPDC088346]|uniref:amino acid adenylation domain-containing protein n=1 Tax=Kitasatospora sp. NPDC088346 TaxID=3364073 RepID=UPI0038008534